MYKTKNNILITAMSLVLIVVFTQETIGQEKATNFLKDYYPIAAFGQYTKNKAGTVIKEDPTVNYEILSNVTAHYGITYNVYQTNHWNFKTGIIIKPQTLSEGFNFTKEQTGLDFNYAFPTRFSCSPCYILSVPLIAEYIIPINHRFKWVIAPSFTISYYRDFISKGLHIISSVSFITNDDDRTSKPLHTSAELSTGFYILFKHFMLQPEFRYSKSFNTIKSGSFTTENYLTEPHSSKGSYKISGDYWGISLSVYIKKRGKNKPRKKRRKKNK